jgi:hypothetical protein
MNDAASATRKNNRRTRKFVGGARLSMDTKQLDVHCFDCKKFFESVFHRYSSKNEPVNQPAKRCICGACLDLITRSHTAETQRFRRHEHALVHKWFDSAGTDDKPAVPLTQEIELEGYTQTYLKRLDDNWRQAEKLLER